MHFEVFFETLSNASTQKDPQVSNCNLVHIGAWENFSLRCYEVVSIAEECYDSIRRL